MLRRLLLAAGFAAGVVLHGQVEVNLEFAQGQYLPDETCEVAVRIVNLSGDSLTFGATADWIHFSVESQEGELVSRLREPEEIGEFALKSSTRGTVRYDIAPMFRIDRPGRFRVVATIQRPGSGESIKSPPAEFEVLRGARIWDKDFGVPGGGGKRRYILQQAHFLKGTRLYARITDDNETETVRVMSLGQLVSFNTPLASLDAGNRLHVLHQIGSDTYLYHRVSVDGTIEVRQMFVAGRARPKLGVNGDGEVAVLEATRRVSPYDLPAVAAEAPAPAPAPVPDASAKAPKS
jgi:hypothetical protein